MACNHDSRFIASSDEGTSYCVLCRALAAEAEVARCHRECEQASDRQLEAALVMAVAEKRIADLRAEADELRAESESEEYGRMCQYAAELRAKVARLRAEWKRTLDQYGGHLGDCTSRDGDADCECGFAGAYRAAKAAGGER